MPAFIHFWGLTPAEWRALTMGEYQAMVTYQNRLQRRSQWDADDAYETIRRLSG
jgi:hypothetical protein